MVKETNAKPEGLRKPTFPTIRLNNLNDLLDSEYIERVRKAVDVMGNLSAAGALEVDPEPIVMEESDWAEALETAYRERHRRGADPHNLAYQVELALRDMLYLWERSIGRRCRWDASDIQIKRVYEAEGFTVYVDLSRVSSMFYEHDTPYAFVILKPESDDGNVLYVLRTPDGAEYNYYEDSSWDSYTFVEYKVKDWFVDAIADGVLPS